MRRRVETIDIQDLRRARRTITIDFSLPNRGAESTRWMIPAAFLSKYPVAPDLEVKDANGGAISIPTKDECMALTALAMDELDAAGAVSLGAAPELRDLAWQVTSQSLGDARVARQIADILSAPDDEWLRSMLFMLEDHFLLWIPAEGPRGADQQIEITRRQPLARDLMFVRRRELQVADIDTPIGPVERHIAAETGPYRFVLGVAVARLQQALGLGPLEYHHEVNEAHRFSSCHLRVLAPTGLVVRDLGLEAPTPGTERDEDPDMRPIDVDASGLTLQGRQLEMAHLHCARPHNPPYLLMMTTLGIRDGLTSLWSGAVIVTALLLLAIVDRASYPIGTDDGSLEVTAAVLLVGPTLASAWALRADHGEVLQTMMVGARWLLLAAAALAVAAAFGLAGFPSTPDEYKSAVQGYAIAAFAIANVVAVGSMVTSRPTWLLYRTALATPRSNLLAICGLAVVAGLVVVHEGIPPAVSGIGLVAVALCLGAIAVHPGPPSTRDYRGLYPHVAAVGALATVFAAAYYLGYYPNLVPPSSMRWSTLFFEAVLAMVALALWYRQSPGRPAVSIRV